jgi:hypothetical protein
MYFGEAVGMSFSPFSLFFTDRKWNREAVGVALRASLGDLCSEKADPLHEKISKQVNQLHSALRNISLTPGFFRAPQEVLHQFWELVELEIITHYHWLHTPSYPFTRKNRKSQTLGEAPYMRGPRKWRHHPTSSPSSPPAAPPAPSTSAQAAAPASCAARPRPARRASLPASVVLDDLEKVTASSHYCFDATSTRIREPGVVGAGSRTEKQTMVTVTATSGTWR